MPQLEHFHSRADYYAALDDYYATLYPDSENDCE